MKRFFEGYIIIEVFGVGRDVRGYLVWFFKLGLELVMWFGKEL